MATHSVIAAEQECTAQPSPAALIAKGKINLAIRNYLNAVGMLAEGCCHLADKYGETADELAEPYLCYGRALLGLAREELLLFGPGLSIIQNYVETEEGEEKNEVPVAGGCAETKLSKAVIFTAVENGKVHKNGQVEKGTVEGVHIEWYDDGSRDLQIAWEVLELSKIIVQRRTDSIEKNKFLSEVHRLLGEVALESGHQNSAIEELTTCLNIMRDSEKVTPRQLAEVHYQLGQAYSLGNGCTKSITNFEQAVLCLDKQMNELNNLKESQQEGDIKYGSEQEIKEVQVLKSSIKEKINEMKGLKQQFSEIVRQFVKEHNESLNVSKPSQTNTSDVSVSTSSSSIEVKPVSDINHPIHKKRKYEDGNPERLLFKKKKYSNLI